MLTCITSDRGPRCALSLHCAVAWRTQTLCIATPNLPQRTWQWMRMPGDIAFAVAGFLMARDFLAKVVAQRDDYRVGNPGSSPGMRSPYHGLS